MRKIPTIFKRDWDGDHKVINEYDIDPKDLEYAVATEKLDGTNIRVTVRNKTVVRVEKRRNPDKIQKLKGIIDPWYVDASEWESQDKYVFDAIKNTDFTSIPDGEWSAEVLGKDIQGNPLNLEKNVVVFFSLGQAPRFDNVPTTFDELKEWLPKQKSKFGNDCGIEGIVWHNDGRMYKIKTKDFR